MSSRNIIIKHSLGHENNFAHFILECLPALHYYMVQHHLQPDDVSLRSNSRHYQALQLFTTNEITKGGDLKNSFQVIEESMGRGLDRKTKYMSQVNCLRERASKLLGQIVEEEVIILVQRRRNRLIVNQTELCEELRKFRPVLPIVFEDLSFIDQLHLCRRAGVLIGAHGAGLAHCAFMPAGSLLVEAFCPGHFAPYFAYSTCYLRSKHVQIEHSKTRVPSTDMASYRRARDQQSFRADIPAIVSAVRAHYLPDQVFGT